MASTDQTPATLFRHAEAAAAPLEAGRLSSLRLSHGSLELRWYAPKGTDAQMPHDKDEIYVVVSGSGVFLRGTERVTFGPGDALFVAARETHRFESFTDDFATWVMFYGPTGGETA